VIIVAITAGNAPAIAREEQLPSFSRCLLALVVVATALSPSTALAQSWPARPVSMVVPFPAGGSTDVLARAVARELSARLGARFVVDNRGGAGGNVGAATVAKAAPDGRTILFGTPESLAINKLLHNSLSFVPQRDFVPIALIAKSPLIIVASLSTHAQARRRAGQSAFLKVGVPYRGMAGYSRTASISSIVERPARDAANAAPGNTEG
jgi:hypothetical protein